MYESSLPSLLMHVQCMTRNHYKDPSLPFPSYKHTTYTYLLNRSEREGKFHKLFSFGSWPVVHMYISTYIAQYTDDEAGREGFQSTNHLPCHKVKTVKRRWKWNSMYIHTYFIANLVLYKRNTNGFVIHQTWTESCGGGGVVLWWTVCSLISLGFETIDDENEW
jgi:hypothetical protein